MGRSQISLGRSLGRRIIRVLGNEDRRCGCTAVIAHDMGTIYFNKATTMAHVLSEDMSLIPGRTPC